MAEGVIEDMRDLFPDDFRWEAVLIQEGPYSESDTYTVSSKGHAVFIGACKQWKRSVAILIHRRWADTGADLKFTAVGRRIAYIDLEP